MPRAFTGTSRGNAPWLAGMAIAACFSVALGAAQASGIVEAAKQRDIDAVRVLIKDGADVNAAQGDGSTALHWAARSGKADLVQMLLYAGANVMATTRLGAYTPLMMAAQGGHSAVVATLIAGGADVNATSATGTTPLMFAAESGDTRTVTMLVEGGADVNGREKAMEQTPLMFAAAYNRVDVVKLLIARGADLKATSKVVDLAKLSNPEEEFSRRQRAERQGAQPETGPRPPDVAGATRQYRYNELVGTSGGFSPLQFAARQGHAEIVKALVEAGADVNQRNPGDESTPLIVATINGYFDIGAYLLEHGADPRLASDNGVTPLYGAINVQWAPKALYPQPRAYLQQQVTYADFMKLLLEKGAEPNVRLTRKVWYSGYNFDLAGVDEIGATPFWRAAYGADVEAMKLLIAYGADPTVPTIKPAGRPRTGDGDRLNVQDVSGIPPVPVGGPAVTPLQAASGVGYAEGFAANSHRYAPTGLLPAMKYLIEELGADVNAADHEGNTALHHAAARGDVESIKYLVSKGADVSRVNREGQTTADMANGPVQRTQPFPEAVALLESLGAKNNHKCVSC
jgi:ankyrin repeat protein